MATVSLIEYEDANDAVRAVYDDILATRKGGFINNFWKALAHNPELLARTWQQIKAVMAPGALDPLTKEFIYIAVSVANGCEYCTHSHTAAARAKGMSPEQYAELLAVIGLAHQTNGLVTTLQVAVDDAFKAD
ncbi:MAG: carboxymuconolactone decarboxylase family protein [Gammaproteobacteria bacterium]|nr:carboxymuconolactone decarboxylase family protein [Gammaproteobacteria bacterium]MCP5198677.1 carboxymuconolactone decarboxylase family protein [Gammaproteobacteria bacterium]